MKTFIDMRNFNRRQYNKDKYYVLIVQGHNLSPEEDKAYRIYLTGKDVSEFKNSFVCIPIAKYCSREVHIQNKYLDNTVGELWHYWKAKTFRDIKIKICDKLHWMSGFNCQLTISFHEIDSFSDYDKVKTVISLCK